MIKRILIVDDEPMILFLLTRYLARLGSEFHVTTCDSGEEALALDADRPFDLIMSDCDMPGMTGRDLAQTLALRRSDVKLVLMSGGDDPALPGSHFLPKPFNPDEAWTAIRLALATAY
ncbi:MAG TPA: response regulator [Anaerolineae bacterium]|nr:response regulator [Anaerolineae bacterium]HMR64976.1 response regulator [Anaerolineae bacterium]